MADAPFAMVPQLRDILGAFLFTGDDIHKRVSVLSGGEKNRLALAKMLLRPSNLLLMDEPTNHLDLNSKEVLLDALRAYTGTVVFVSHDRHFIDGLASRVVEVEAGGITSYHGDYEYYLAKKGEGAAVSSPAASPSSETRIPHPESRVPGNPPKEERQRQREDDKQRQKENRQLQKKLAEIEKGIETAEGMLAELEGKMADPAFFADRDAARLAGEKHAELTARIAGLYEEWEELHGSGE